MGSITLNTRAERRKLLNKNTRTRVDTQMIGTKKNTFQFELKNRFTALEEHDDMDSLNKNMTEMIQQRAMSIAKQTKKQKKPKMSSPTRALKKKRRQMIENNTPRDHIEYVEICRPQTIKSVEASWKTSRAAAWLPQVVNSLRNTKHRQLREVWRWWATMRDACTLCSYSRAVEQQQMFAWAARDERHVIIIIIIIINK